MIYTPDSTRREKVYLDKSCLVCGTSWTRLGFICEECYRRRYGTIHSRWNAPVYVRATHAEAETIEANEARAALKAKGLAA